MYRNKYIVGFQTAPILFCILNFDFTLHNYFRSNTILDLHSIYIDNDTVYVCSTGDDSICSFELDEDFLPYNTKTIWSKRTGRTDAVNSVIKHEDCLIISNFGKDWRNDIHNSKGSIIDITNNKILAEDINQPHTLTNIDGSICFCESGKSVFHILNKQAIQLSGYLRGIAYDHQDIYLGVSGERIQSKSKKRIYKSYKWAPEKAKVLILDKPTGDLKETIDLNTFGHEIFDLFKIELKPNQLENIAIHDSDIQVNFLKEELYKHRRAQQIPKNRFVAFMKKRLV